MDQAPGAAAAAARRSGRKKTVRSVQMENLTHREEKLLKFALEKSLVDVRASEFEPLLLDQAPVLHPTREEFADPLAYIKSQRHAIAPYGIATIVPPAGWKPPFTLRSPDLRFDTKRQLINHLGEGLPYEDGAMYDMREYEAQADSSRAVWEHKLRALGRDPQAFSDWEQTYWEIVEGGEDVVVDYGNDVSTEDFGCAPWQRCGN
jgi:hypothetical protein